MGSAKIIYIDGLKTAHRMAGSMEAQLMEPKKTLIVHILDILRRYSDAEHTLSQKDILAQ